MLIREIENCSNFEFFYAMFICGGCTALLTFLKTDIFLLHNVKTIQKMRNEASIISPSPLVERTLL